MPSTPFASGGRTATFVDNNAIVSGSIASGQIGRTHISSGAINSGHIASGNTLIGPLIPLFIDFQDNAAEPASPISGDIRLYGFDEKGFPVLRGKDDTGFVVEYAQDTILTVRNTSGSTLVKGTVVSISGSNSNVATVDKALATSLATMPTIGFTVEDIANNSFGRVMTLGILSNIDTSAFTEGDRLFVSDTVAGTVTSTPTAFPNIQQRVAIVIRSHATQGQIQVIVGTSSPLLSGAITSGMVASGQLGHFTISSGAITSGQIGATGTPNGLQYLRDDFSWTNPQRVNVRMVSASGAILANDNIVLVSGTITLNLPNPTTTGSGGIYTTKLVVSGGTLTVSPFATETIDSFSGSVSLGTQNQSLTFVNDGVNWWIV